MARLRRKRRYRPEPGRWWVRSRGRRAGCRGHDADQRAGAEEEDPNGCSWGQAHLSAPSKSACSGTSAVMTSSMSPLPPTCSPGRARVGSASTPRSASRGTTATASSGSSATVLGHPLRSTGSTPQGATRRCGRPMPVSSTGYPVRHPTGGAFSSFLPSSCSSAWRGSSLHHVSTAIAITERLPRTPGSALG